MPETRSTRLAHLPAGTYATSTRASRQGLSCKGGRFHASDDYVYYELGSRDSNTMLQRLGWGALAGAAVGGLGLFVGLIRAGVAILGGGRVSFDDFFLPAFFYMLSFAAAGLLLGAAWPLHERRGGSYLLGVLSAFVFMGGIVTIEDGPPWRWTTDSIVIWAALSVVFGLAAGHGLSKGGKAAA